MLVFIFYLLPQIAELLGSMDNDNMPLGVVLALGLKEFLSHNWIFILGFMLVVSISGKLYLDNEENKASWDAKSIHLPFYGNVLKFGFYVQWLQTLANLLANGVPLVKSLELTNETVQNRYFKTELAAVVDRVKDGLKLTTSMKQAGIFPAAMIDLVAVGDQTGKLEAAVSRAAEYYEEKLGTVLKAFMGIITPVVLLGMAILVGVLCSTMMQAISGAMDNMR